MDRDPYDYEVVENKITFVDPRLRQNMFDKTVPKDTHKYRKRLVQSKQYPNLILGTDPQSSNIFIFDTQKLELKGNSASATGRLTLKRPSNANTTNPFTL